PAAIRTAIEVRVAGSFAVERFHESLSFLRRLVDSAITEVGDLFAMAASPARIDAVSVMSGVGGRGCIPLGGGCRQRFITDGACESTVADALEFAVPTGDRKPYFGSNVGIRRRLDRERDAAECCRNLNGVTFRRLEGPDRDCLSTCNRGVGQRLF